jgi:hypothetical protein
MTAARSRFEPTVNDQHANDVSHFHCERIEIRTVGYELRIRRQHRESVFCGQVRGEEHHGEECDGDADVRREVERRDAD